MKFDQDVPTELEDISKTIKLDWSIDGKYRPTLIAASTHETEEEVFAAKQILKTLQMLCLFSCQDILKDLIK